MARREVINYLRLVFGECGGAAVAGNIDVETGGTFNYQQKQGGGGPGYGLFQMEPPMHKAYDEYLKKNKAADSAKSQINYAKEEVQHGGHIGAGNAKKIRDAFASGNVETATRTFCDIFEKPGVPHLDRRIAASKKIFAEK